MKIEINGLTGEVIVRELTDDEQAQLDADRQAWREEQAALDAAAAAKISARAKLSALGLTDAEIAALAG